jgi:hypothetical protein
MTLKQIKVKIMNLSNLAIVLLPKVNASKMEEIVIKEV